jgi:hypothetical protein
MKHSRLAVLILLSALVLLAALVLLTALTGLLVLLVRLLLLTAALLTAALTGLLVLLATLVRVLILVRHDVEVSCLQLRAAARTPTEFHARSFRSAPR